MSCENHRKYDTVGTVTMSTQEYRDLIEDLNDSESKRNKDLERYRSLYAEDQEEIRKLHDKMELWESFLEDHATVKADWNMFLARNMHESSGE